jgi:oligopeptide transport system ATP-binding protein
MTALINPVVEETNTGLLAVRHLQVQFGTDRNPVAVVDDVAFDLEPGKVLGIAGESGSGKTMTALAMLGLLPAGSRVSGHILLEGRNVLELRGRALRKIQGQTMAMVFQDPTASLHPMLTIGRQLTEHMQYHLRLSRGAANERAVELLDQVRIPDPRAALHAYPHQFSGGMRQRIQIAIALACHPKILIADEPTTALDVTVQAGILALLDRLCREQELAVVLITHDLGVLSAIADSTMVMYAGKVVESGTTQQILRETRHPYTRGLLDALPHPGTGEESLVPIRGMPPNPAHLPTGCPFHPRCPFAQDACARVEPPLAAVAHGHTSACIVDPLGPGATS